MIVRNYPITTDNVRNVGGKDMILSRMVNHYSALSEVKPVVDTKAPHPKVKKTPHEIKGDLFRREQFHNVREAYKKVSNAKSYIDNKEPTTFKKKRKNCFKSVKEKYEDIEHLRTLKAMSKRILSIGKMHERKKNRFDPIANPTYFFLNAQKRDSNNEATKLISLKNLNAKLKVMNEDKKNKLLLGNTVYEAVNNIDVDNWIQKCNKNITRPKSAVNNYNKSYYDNEKNRKNKKLKNNAILEEYNPEKFMKIHKFNRENEGDKIVKRRQKKKAEEEKANLKNKNVNNISKPSSMTLKSKINKGLLIEQIPIYIDDEPNGEDYAFNKFNDDVRQFIIVNNIYRDEDYDVLIEELVKKNNNKKNLTRTAIEKTVLDIKNALDD
jgi:hypothetical protein